MANEDRLNQLKQEVSSQGDLVRRLKMDGAESDTLSKAVEELQLRKKALQDALKPQSQCSFDRTKIEDLLKRRFFYAPSFEIYGGVAGLYDYGPMGAAMESSIIDLWRHHFVIHDQMMEVRCSQLTPHNVLEASGHVKKFTDLMVKDVITGDCHRADHLVKAQLEKIESDPKIDVEKRQQCESHLRQLENYDADQLDQLVKDYEIKAPGTGNALTKAERFNLMFATSIGPTGALPGYMRPETAQGIFVNFKRLLEFNNNKLPFAAAQVGCGFRNEISPRSGLLRVREFMMAEIEHFVDPINKHHPRFSLVSQLRVTLYPSVSQLDGDQPQEFTLDEAVSKGVIANSTLAYYVGRIQTFLLQVGIIFEKLRFRQHLPNEMAHYACDCWDAEIETSYGWVECVGCADRSCYDLQQHAIYTKQRLVAQRELPSPVSVTVAKVVLDKKHLGIEFKKDARAVASYIEAMPSEQVDELEKQIQHQRSFEVNIDNKSYNISSKMVLKVERRSVDVHVANVEPHVIEPSFGLGRIMYAVFEHTFKTRTDDPSRNWLALPAAVAPVKCAVLPLSKRAEFDPYVEKIVNLCSHAGLSYRKDDNSGSIGRRYARNDEIGTPFIFTVDFDTTLEPDPALATVTLRERDTMDQIRVAIPTAVEIASQLVNKKEAWSNIVAKHGLFLGQTQGPAST